MLCRRRGPEDIYKIRALHTALHMAHVMAPITITLPAYHQGLHLRGAAKSRPKCRPSGEKIGRFRGCILAALGLHTVPESHQLPLSGS